MLSIPSATNLLSNARSTTAREAILTQLGFALPRRPLPQHARTQLGIPAAITSAHVARGPGDLRALDCQIHPTANTREVITSLAKQLSAKTPHLLWLAITTQPPTPAIAIATWLPSIPPKISALVATSNQLVQSDAETLCTLVATTQLDNDAIRHARWLEILGRESVTNRFYRIIERQILHLAHSLPPSKLPSQDAHTLALLYTSRLLFLSFLQTKGWLNNDHDFLINQFVKCLASGGNYHRNTLQPLFFGTLNTRPSQRATRAHAFGKIPFLNGGLFTRTPLESRSRHLIFPNDALGALHDNVFSRFRFTPHEDSHTWSQSAIDPEMLGKVFESLMSSPDRKSAGTFYTPQPVVNQVTTAALQAALGSPQLPHDIVNAALEAQPLDNTARGLLLDRISTLKILDPACGSGAFLVHTLERLASLRAQLGDLRPISAIRRALLVSNIYGVDINPTAVWLCELRLWLSVVIDNTEPNATKILPLPNLDHNIRVGDSLTTTTIPHTTDSKTAHAIASLRLKYARATGQRKKILAKTLDHAERQQTLAHLDISISRLKTQRKDILLALRSPNLFTKRTSPSTSTQRKLAQLKTQLRRLYSTRRLTLDGGPLPFSFPTHFPDITTLNGFSLILGNPPWVRVHHIDPAQRSTLKQHFSTFRNAPWHTGAQHAHASLGFAAQIDLAALFLEQATQLLANDGALALLLPSKLWRSLAGGGTRRLVAEKLSITTIQDFSETNPLFDAATYPSLIAATKQHTPNTNVTIHLPLSKPSWTIPNSQSQKHVPLALTPEPDSPWIFLSPNARTAFDTITNAGIPLAQTHLGRPHLGVKSGYNNAFLVHEKTCDPNTNLSTISNNQRTAIIETEMLRPIIKGESITPWIINPTNERIIWTHSPANKPLRKLPHHTWNWLRHSQRKLTHRSDVRRSTPWWTLFRTFAAQSHTPRVVWADFGRSPKAAVIPAYNPITPLNTCYVICTQSIEDAYTLTALLNSPLTAAWLHSIAEPARGNYRRYLGWTISLLPVPKNWTRARQTLAPIAHTATLGNPPHPEELLDATLHAFAIHKTSVQPLLQWHNQLSQHSTPHSTNSP